MSVVQYDVILIGSGVMSANLAVLLKRLDPGLRIQVYEASSEVARESSDGWNNAGTGHAGLCELSYTPERNVDGTVDVTNAIKIFRQFEQSREFWAYAVTEGILDKPRDFINPVPHISFVHGAEQVEFLRARYEAMSAHPYFASMEYSEDADVIRQWAPLLIEGRQPGPIAATRMADGTDVNFGQLSRKLLRWFDQQTDCDVNTDHRVSDLRRTDTGWHVTVKNLKQGQSFVAGAKFVFIGAGGGSLPLLQKSDIDEGKGFGGFPIGGQWLVCDDPRIVDRHRAKVYGQAQGEAPTMAVPHLDARIIDGKRAVLFGPFAAWTTRFLKDQGHWLDLPSSIRPNNIASLLKVGAYNLPLVKYLVQQGLQSMENRMQLLRTFYPDAKTADWRLLDAGIRVQAIKRTDGKAGIVHYGTEIVTDSDRTIAALLGASPGASVSVALMLDVIKKCLPESLRSDGPGEEIGRMIPSHDADDQQYPMSDSFRQSHQFCDESLQLTAALHA